MITGCNKLLFYISQDGVSRDGAQLYPLLSERNRPPSRPKELIVIGLKKLIFWMHLACGISLGLVVFTMSLTGVVLTYEKQISRWADGYDIQPPSAEAKPLGPAALLQQAQLKTGKSPTSIQFRSSPDEPVRVSFGREAVMLDPYSGATLSEGATGVRSFFRTMIVWHRWLGQTGDGRAVGKAITGACNLGFLFIIISGAYLWWPRQWTWQYVKPVVFFRRGLPPKARDFNWHNVFGVWFAIPLFLVVATGAFFSYSWPGDLLYIVTGEERPQRSPSRSPGSERVNQPEPPSFDGLDTVFGAAVKTQPGWKIATLQLVQDPTAPVVVTLDMGNGFRPDLRTPLTLNRQTGEIVRRETYADMGRAQSARIWIRWLHTGEAGGWLGQTLAGAASLAACFLVYTGWMLSWRRFLAWRERR